MASARACLRRGYLVGTSLVGMISASAAYGQTVTQPAVDGPNGDATAPAAEIVVTGSHIPQSITRAASPIVSLDEKQIRETGRVDVEGIIGQLPQASPAQGATNNDGSGIATVDLRGLGASRTLVLVNGRRYIAANTNQVVDLNTVPTALITRVDVVTGGRSAVYGSDAIAGVVNFVLKDDFSGLQFDGQSGISSHGDGAQQTVSITAGANTSDGRGNITLFASYNDRKGIRGSDRRYSAQAYDDVGDGTLYAGGSGQNVGGRLLNFGPSQRFLPNGSLAPFSFDTDSFNYDADLYNQLPNKRWVTSGSAHYQFAPAFTLYAEGQFIDSKSQIGEPATGIAGVQLPIQVSSPFLPASTQAFLSGFDPTGTGYVTASMSRRFVELGTRAENYHRQSYRGVIGLRGDIGGGWHYDGYYSYDHYTGVGDLVGGLSTSRLQNATNTAFADPSTLSGAHPVLSAFPIAGLPGGGALVCASAAARTAGCVPANIYGANRLSPEAIAYLTAAVTNRERSTTQVANFTLTNPDLFDIGFGGPVGIAVGAEWRRESAAFVPDPQVAAGDIQGFTAGSPTGGHYDVKELFAETTVPIVQDRPFAKLIELNGAVRYSDYSTGAGSVATWSVGGLYRPVADIGFRAQFQRAVRAPNVNELFEGNQQVPATVPDPCNGAAVGSPLAATCVSTGVPTALIGTQFNPRPQYYTIEGGSTALNVERSNTFTGGVVLTPHAIPNFTLSVDYYDIQIKGYIGTLGASNILGLCYGGVTAFCSAVTRDRLSGEITSVDDRTVNAGAFKTSGIDFAASYRIGLGSSAIGDGDGALSLNSQVTYLLTRTYTPIAAIPSVKNVCDGMFGATCGQPNPHWRGLTRVTLTEGPVSVSGQWQYIGASNDDGTLGYTLAVTHLKPKSYFDLGATFQVEKRFTFGFGVNNLFNVEPQILGDNDQFDTANTYPALYDVVGRRFYVNVSAKF